MSTSATSVSLKIDGKKISVAPGTVLLDACQAAGADVPSLCYLKDVSCEASCALCVVEVKGARSLVRACAAAVTDGMTVTTTTAQIERARRVNLELILADHPLDCMTCDRDGDCTLQDLAYRYGIKKSRFLEQKAVFDRPVKNAWSSNPFIHHDAQKCVRCGRCINACRHIATPEVIGWSGRGDRTALSTPLGMPLEETGCQFCGACIQACPVGALIERPRMRKGKAKDLVFTDTVCAYCGVGCNLSLGRDRHNDLVMARCVENPLVNNGRGCVKGRYGYEYVNKGDRLTTPLIRKNGKLRKASWKEAIAYTAQKLQAVKKKYGPDAIGVLGSSRCSNEDNYVVQKLARAVIGTNNVDNCARLCHSSTVAGLGIAFGAGAATNSLQDITDTDVMFVIGSNMAETHPVIAQIVRKHQKESGAKLVVCDPRRVGVAQYADLFGRQYPGTDVALLNGIMKIILDKKLENRSFIKAHTEGIADLKKTVAGYGVQKVSRITGIDAQTITDIAIALGKAKRMMIFFAMGITQHSTGVDNVLSIANLAMLTGNIGKRGAGVMPLRGQANVQGACDLGALPNVYPGYQKVNDPAARAKFEKAWGVPLSNAVGLPVSVYADLGLKGKMKALYIMGENPLMTEADIEHVRRGFAQMDFIATQAIFLSETAEVADVVFPAAAAYEKDGTFTNTDRRVQPLQRARTMPEGAKDDWAIVCEVATAMGYSMKYKDAAAITDEIASLTPSYGGITARRLEKESVQWPCPDEKHPGTLYLYDGGVFKRPGGKGLFAGITFKPPQEVPDKKYPLILSTGRMLYHFHSGNETRRVKAIHTHVPENYVELNPADAKKYGIADGDKVTVSTRRGSITVKAHVGDRPKKGVIFVPFHFREAAANRLTNPALDPVSRIPEYKACAASVKKV